MAKPYYLIDFENVQPKALGSLVLGESRIKVFLGQQQTKLMLDLVQALQPRMQFSRFRCRVKNGRIGSREKTAPIGHRKRQKKRSSKNMPTRISTRRTMPGI